jgi:hypothetical protein
MNATRPWNDTELPGTSDNPHPFGLPLQHCPACGSDQLRPVSELDTGQVHFLCGACGKCWHVELGYVRTVTTEWCHR